VFPVAIVAFAAFRKVTVIAARVSVALTAGASKATAFVVESAAAVPLPVTECNVESAEL
jgi:hypothetical protein